MLTVAQAVKVHEWADRCAVKIEPYWCDIQRVTIEYEVTHNVELDRFGVEHHSEKSLINEAQTILSQSEEVMGRVRKFLSQNTIQWYEAWDNELQIREAMEIYGMTLKDMGVEG